MSYYDSYEDDSVSEDLPTPSPSSSSLTLLEYPLCFQFCIPRRQRVNHMEKVKAQRRRRALRLGRPDPYPPQDGACACCSRRCPASCVLFPICEALPAPPQDLKRNKSKRAAQWQECSYSPSPLEYSASSTEWDLVRKIRAQMPDAGTAPAPGAPGAASVGAGSFHRSTRW